MEQFSELVNKARIHWLDSEYAEAESWFREALKIRPQDCSLEKEVNVNTELADALFMQKKFAEAEDYYEMSINLIKDDENLKQWKGVCYMRLGSTLGKLGRFIEAEKYLKAALTIINSSPMDPENPGEPEVNKNASTIYHNLAELMYYLCNEEEETRYRTIAKNIDHTLETIENAIKDGVSTTHIMRRYVKPCAEAAKGKYEDKAVYRLDADVRGFCLIINNKDFASGEPRKGSEIDEANVSNVFKQLKFEVVIERNLIAEDLIDKVKILVEGPEINKHDAFVLVIMSHGQEDFRIIGADGKSARQQDILHQVFAARKLEGKPRLLFIQACKGDAKSMIKNERDEREAPTTGVKIDNPNSSNTSQQECPVDVEVPKENQPRVALDTVNCCIMDATINGCVAFRDPLKGSPFIYYITEALFKYSHMEHIEKIFDEAVALMRAAGVEQEPTIKKFGHGKKLYLCL